MADQLFGITHPGQVRLNNEDVFIAQKSNDGQFMIAGVIDGVGGYEGGEIAAAITKEIVLNELAEIGKDITAQLDIAFLLANEEIIAKKIGNKDLAEMACVATVAVIDMENNQLYYIHVGDTRLYLFRDNSLVKISHDQSFVGFLEDSGRLTEEAAMQHPKRNQIDQALGLTSRDGMTNTYFETGTSPFLPGDLILVCSDGLTDLVTKEELVRVLSKSDSLENKAGQLVDLANAAGGKDNITVVLSKNDKPVKVHESSRPVAEVSKPIVAAPIQVTPVITDNAPINREIESQPKTNSHKGLILLSLLCMILLASTIFLFVSRPNEPTNEVKNAVIPLINIQEKRLTDTLAKFTGDTLLLSADIFKEPIRLTKPLNFTQDTLVIKTKGKITFVSDSAYKGPAMIFSAACKYISIDSVVFEHFETAIVAYNNALDLNNTRFNQCKHALQVLFEFPDQYFVNGRISKRAYHADSTSKK